MRRTARMGYSWERRGGLCADRDASQHAADSEQMPGESRALMSYAPHHNAVHCTPACSPPSATSASATSRCRPADSINGVPFQQAGGSVREGETSMFVTHGLKLSAASDLALAP